MTDIKEFLRSHPLISPSSVEKLLDIPKSTIRLNSNNPIPDKYKERIIDLLKKYDGEREGDNIVSSQIVNPEISKPNKPVLITGGIEHYTKMVKLVNTSKWICGIYYKMPNGAFTTEMNAEYPDGTKVYIKEII